LRFSQEERILYGGRAHEPFTSPVIRIMRYSLVVGLLLLGGCIPLGHGYALSRKTVATKEGESMLVADDGAWCAVTPRAFRDVQPGDEYSCVWKEPDEKPRKRTPPPPTIPPPAY
jgi:hypothetical protein